VLQRSLDLLTVLDDLEKGLFDRAPALANYAALPGSTPTSVASALISEVTAARTPTGAGSSAPVTSGAPQTASLSSAAFEDATNKSAAFQNLSAAVLAAPHASSQDRINLIALGFNGQCVISVRCMLSVTTNGDPDSSKSPALQRLNSMRGERYLYFNYMLTVAPATGLIPQRLKDYEFASPTSTVLLDQFLRRQYSTMD
jgi:hypothetical protein